MERTRELEEQVRRLTRMVEEMRSRMSQLEAEAKPGEKEKSTHSRRQLLKLGGAAALGAVGSAALRVMPAAAADGDTMHVGTAHTANSPTTIVDSAGGSVAVPVFGVTSQNFSPTLFGNAGETFYGALWVKGDDGGTVTPAPVDGLDAFASGSAAFAVYGLTDTGTGVTGESGSGIGLYARGTGRLRQDGLPGAGPPLYTPNNYEQVRDANGTLWLHDSVGTWRPMYTVIPIKPVRILDTRGPNFNNPPKAPDQAYPVQVTAVHGIPGDAVAVVGNLTAVGYTGPGFLSIMPQGASFNPSADPSTVNFITGQAAIPNSFTCAVNVGNKAVQVWVGGASSNFIVDVTAYIH
jgi:hypothetical protein